MNSSSQNYQQFHPRYWALWFFLGILYLLVKLPYSWQLTIGRSIGNLAYYVARYPRQIANTNLRLCFPALSNQEIKKTLKKHFQSLGIAVLETGMSWWMPDEKLLPLFQIEGLEHLEKIIHTGKGVLLCTAHSTTIEICSRAKLPLLYGIYREQIHPIINKLLLHHRSKGNLTLIHRHNIRSIVNQLKNGNAVWYAADQEPGGKKNSVFVPFFGVPAATLTTPSRLATIGNANVLMCSTHRQDNNKGYRLVYGPILENFPSGDLHQDATRMNQELEILIKKSPEQYLWTYERFKTRPDGENKIYKNQIQ